MDAGDGVLYVEILPSTQDIKRQVESDFKGAFTQAEKSGQGFLGRIGSGISGFVKQVGGTVTGILGSLAVAAGTGGISRVLNIEDATAKLKGLGHQADVVDKIMSDALASVKGTAFGLDSAAKIAASSVAAGIKPGKELERHLRLTADAATIAGISLDEMGSIMNRVQANGRAFTLELNMLADRGIPIFQWLAKEYGVTQEELRKMVAAGKIDAETFRRVLEENIGGAALESGATTRGAFRNVMAALSRFGAAFAGPALAPVREFFVQAIGWVDALTERAAPLGEKFGEVLGRIVDGAGPLLERLGEISQGLGKLIPPELNGPAVGAVVGLFASMGKYIPIIGKFLPAIGGPLGIIAGAITGLVASSPKLREALGGAFRKIAEAAGPLFEAVGGIVQTILEGLAPILDRVAPLLMLVADVFAGLAPLLGIAAEFVWGLVEALMPLIPLLLELAEQVFPLLVGAVEWVMSWLGPLAEWVGGFLVGAFNALSDGVKFWADIFTKLMGLGEQTWRQFGAAFDWVWKNVIEPVFGFFVSVGENTVAAFRAAWDGIGNWFKGLWDGVGEFFRGLMNGIIDTINWAIDAVNFLAGWAGVNVPRLEKLVDGAASSGSGRASGGGFADGGRVYASGPYWVGEEGPEIVNLRAGDFVTPNHDLGGRSVEVTFVNEAPLGQSVEQALAQFAVRAQAVFG